MGRRAIAAFLGGVMLLSSSCATTSAMRPGGGRAAEAAAGRGGEVSMVGGGLALLAFTAVIIGATQVKDKSARAWLWTGIGALLFSGLYLETGERRRPEREQEIALGRRP